MKYEPEHKAFLLTEAKAIESESGSGAIECWGNTIFDVDRYGDVVLEYKDVEEFVKDGFISDTHGLGAGKMGNHTVTNTIGMPLEARVDSKGLYCKWEWCEDPESQNLRIKTEQRVRNKKSVFLSIGYNVTEAPIFVSAGEYKTVLPKFIPADRLQAVLLAAKSFQRLRLIRVSVFEISVVPRPVNTKAEVIGVKSLGDNMKIEFTEDGFKGQFLGEDIEDQLCMALLDRLYCRLQCRMSEMFYAASQSDVPVDMETMNSMVDEFASMYKEISAKIQAGSEEMTEAKALYSEPKEFKASLTGNLLTAKASFAIKAVENYKSAVAKEIAKVKESDEYKAGRKLSAATEKKVADYKSKGEQIKALSSEMTDGMQELIDSLYSESEQKALQEAEMEFKAQEFYREKLLTTITN